MNETAILVNVRDRPTELALLLQSLRTQTYQDFDIYILDDQSGTPLNNYHFMKCLVNQLTLESHQVFMKRTEFQHGVSKARQAIVDWALERSYRYLCRVDDDVILEPDYLQKLVSVIEDQDYDMASGVTVPMTGPTFKRNPQFVNKYVNRVILDEEGNYIMNGDDCGMEYLGEKVLPAHHFRSCALYKAEIHDKANYLPNKLSMHGFREEQIFSYRILMAGFKIGVDLSAKNYHQLTPSGGERFATSNEDIKFNQQALLDFTKKHKEELNKLFPRDNMPSKQELMKENNLLMQ